jgi:glycosyltransferase involved in cell wall biosynthesis
MKIGIMLRHFRHQPGGIGTYTNNLLDHLLQIDTDNQYTLIYNEEGSLGSYSDYPNVHEVVVKSISKGAWDQVAVPAVAEREQLDVIFNPKLSIPLLAKCNKVFVMHGGDWFRFPGNYGLMDQLYHRIAASIYCKNADAIISVSHSATKDIIDALGISPDKITTVYHGVSPNFCPEIADEKLEALREKYKLPDQIILYVGQIYPMKNVEGIIRAFINIRKRLPHKLVLVGQPTSKGQHELALIDRFQLRDDVILTGWVPDEDLPVFYHLASLFVFPSFYEGFGIPLLEAMACGCPIVTSNSGATSEVVEDAAVLVDPWDVNSISDGMYRVLTDDVLKGVLIQKGLQRVKAFSWGKCARETLGVLENLNCQV